MDIKTTIYRRKEKKAKGEGKGKKDRRAGKWVAEIRFSDPDTGDLRRREKQFELRVQAVEGLKQMVSEIERTGGRIATGAAMSFHDLCEKSKATFYKPAVIHEGRKIDGVRSYRSVIGCINTLCEYFGKKPIGKIEQADLRAYRVWRLRRPTTGDRASVSLTAVNRDLQVMRRMMKYAFQEGWVLRDIFAGAKVIDIDAEKARTRLLTAAEEELLLAACEVRPLAAYTRTVSGKRREVKIKKEDAKAPNNEYLRAVILLALDSAMRRGEILKLRWQDFDFENNLVLIVGTHTKTEKERLAPLTNRTIAELRNLPNFGSAGNVFPFSGFKRSWATAKRIAGVEDLRFHDLRRTAITKLNAKGIPLATAGKIAGHARLETTMKHYIGSDAATISEVARILNEAPAVPPAESDFVN